jgi:flagellar biosynthetic protein FliQ
VGDFTREFALSLSAHMLWVAISVCLPILGLSMLVGLAVSVLQAVTQIQEASIAFVVKIGTVAVTLLVFGPWMLAQITDYARHLIVNIPNYF